MLDIDGTLVVVPIEPVSEQAQGMVKSRGGIVQVSK